MHDFREVLEACDLMDMGFQERWFIWERGNFALNNIRERLDRGVASASWYDVFPNYTVTHLNNSCSDHCSLLLDTKSISHLGNNVDKFATFKIEQALLL